MIRVRRFVDSWALAVVLAAAAHLSLVWATWPLRPPAPEAMVPSFTLLAGGSGGGPFGAPGGGGGGPGGGGGEAAGGDTPIVLDYPRRAEVAPPQMLRPLEARDLPPGGTMPVAILDRSKERASLVEQVSREQRVRAALETAGVTSLASGSPGGSGGVSGGGGGGGGGGSGFGGGGGGGGDPELYRWKTEVEALFRDAFHPLVPSQEPLVCRYLVDYDPKTGVVIGFAPHESSGVPAFDAAAERAIRSIVEVPLPPERYAAQVGTRLLIDFHPP